MNKTLYRPKLESGTKATLWSPMSVYTSSLIKQTADSIILEVESITGDTEERLGRLEVTSSAITNTVSALTQSVSGNTYNITQLNIRANGIEGRVEQIENGGTSENLFVQNGFMDKEENFVIPDDNMMYSAATSYITSQKVHLEAGTYCVSLYSKHGGIGRYFATKDMSGNTISPTRVSATTETYCDYGRIYSVLSGLTEGDYKFVFGDNSTDSLFYRPKLEVGDVPTVYTDGEIKYSSLITQTSKEISLKVQEESSENGVINKFKETGLDITSGRIELNADNTVVNGNLQLHATNDSDALTLYDDDDIERTTVTSNEIGGIDSQSLDSSRGYTAVDTINQYGSTVWDLGTKYYAANSVVNANSSYPFAIQYIGYYYDESLQRNNGRVITNPESCTLTLQLVSDAATYTVPTTMDSTASGQYTLTASPNGSVTVDVAGTYTIRVTLTWANGSTISPFTGATVMRITTYVTSESPSKTLIGSDGLYATNGTGKYIYYGTDGLRADNTNNTNGYITSQSSVGTCISTYDATTGTYSDEYTYYAGTTGPSHIAQYDYLNGGEYHWVNSQQYCNIQTAYPDTNNAITESVMASIDLVLVSNFFNSDKNLTLNLEKAQYNGHILEIRNTRGYGVNLTGGSGVAFKYLRGDDYTTNYANNFYSVRLVYMYGSMTDTYSKGCWYILAEESY